MSDIAIYGNLKYNFIGSPFPLMSNYHIALTLISRRNFNVTRRTYYWHSVSYAEVSDSWFDKWKTLLVKLTCKRSGNPQTLCTIKVSFKEIRPTKFYQRNELKQHGLVSCSRTKHLARNWNQDHHFFPYNFGNISSCTVPPKF